MNGQNLTPQERDFLWALEEIEARQVAMGDLDCFVELQEVCRGLSLELSQGLELARSLARRRLLLLDRSTGTDIVKSKVANIIRSLFHTTTLVQNRLVRDVSDLKYLRFIKQIPQLTISLQEREMRESLLAGLDSKPSPKRNVVESGIRAIASRYLRVSAFQLSATQEILELLGKKKHNQSLVIVAETGAGKTLAYQLPLLLWVLSKKMKAYLKRKSGSKTDLAVNCSALLLFPRNVLAKDQYDELVDLSARLSDNLKRLKLPTDLTSFLQIKVERDFGGVGLKERTRIYQSCPDIIITNPDTLKRRLMNPLCASLYRKGIDLVLYDEIHLYYGLFGANVASLNARLQNLLPWPPVFVGMSATIANPQKHSQKLFSVKNLPDVVTDRDDMLSKFSLEHHVIIKPRAGRPSLGVCIDTTSCLLHNRREDTMRAHQLGNELRSKSLCFVDSLDLTGRWVSDQKNYENFQLFPAVRMRFHREYPIHFAPWAVRDPRQTTTCRDCKSGRDVVASLCNEYQEGRCWWFSQDSASPVRWLPLSDGVTPNDNIRVKRLTSQEVDLSELEDIYGLFNYRFDQSTEHPNLPVDALVATSVLEVGVDFRGIKEVVMYGEIRSPSSYKQKAGRGAREGNLHDGLFVLTVIPPSPLASFYYRHFHRLVYPSLAPLPLEPRNPDIIRSHAFCAVFDFLALKGIDVFNVITANQNPEQVEEDFNRAISFIRTEAQNAKDFVVAYLRRLSETTTRAQETARNAIDRTLEALEYLSSEYEIEGEKKKVIIWAFEAFRDMGTMKTL
ncbi:MAG: DEAD/DEAH box helicase, partial [Candidatus Bathyarchaeota archaeon]|nr:DEAD/DEAH box helicase [Candidatus Bathyarchaeota archaeon]